MLTLEPRFHGTFVCMKRLSALDYLRGLAALAILLYHYCSWVFGQFGASSVLGRVGIYGVAIFYLLSGLTFYAVYHSRFKLSLRWHKKFYLKRFLRIFPLLWLATFLHLFFVKGPIDADQLLLNVSGLFGFLSWDHYFATGAWSIGNELVFYAFLPFIFFAARRGKRSFSLLFAVFGVLYLVFAFHLIDPSSTLAEQWHLYTNPLNQAFLFIGGYAIGLLRKHARTSSKWSITFAVVGMLLFMLYPVEGNRLQLVCGVPRVVFTLSCALMVLGFTSINWRLNSLVHRPLAWLGHISFSLYLLHPIVFETTDRLLGNAMQQLFGSSAGIVFVIAFIASLLASSLSYYFIEKPITSLSRINWSPSDRKVSEKPVTLRNHLAFVSKRISSFRLW